MAEEVNNTETVSSEIPDWVDPAYGYDPANPRKPNMREMMKAISGSTPEELYASGNSENVQSIIQQANELLYGVVGSNQDTRDFSNISSNNMVKDTLIATEKMYQPAVVQLGDDNNFGIVSSDGTLLRGGYGSYEQALSQAQDSFGLGTSFSTTSEIPEGMTEEQVNAVVNLADGVFLSQTTGVDQNVLNELKVAAGLSVDTPLSDMGDGTESVQKLLTQYGYNVGNSNFYGGSTLGGPKDAGAVAFFDAYKNAVFNGYMESTTENIQNFGGKIDPRTGQEYRFMTNDNIANQVLIQDLLKDTDQETMASAPVGDFDGIYDKKYLQQEQVAGSSYGVDITGDLYNSLQWLPFGFKKIINQDNETTTSSTENTGQVSVDDNTNVGSSDQTNQTGSSGNVGYITTPFNSANTGTTVPQTTGTTQTQIPTFEQGLGNQEASFINRQGQNNQFFQPQTLQEQTTAGTNPGFENRLYKNNFGMTMYIQFINGQAMQPIPPGYFPVTAQAQNQGGMVQSFSGGGTVNPPLNFKPGGNIIQEGDQYKIKYPDGTFSQGYATQENAQAANSMALTNLGLPLYDQYLQEQGVNPNLPGYDQQMYVDAFNAYVSDPNTLAAINAQKAADEAAKNPVTSNINQNYSTDRQEVTVDDLAQYQRNLTAQAYGAPGGAVAAAPTSYIDPNTYGSVIESTAGQAMGVAPIVRKDEIAQMGTGVVADQPTSMTAGSIDAQTSFSDVKNALPTLSPAANQGSPTRTITAQQQVGSSIAGMEGAQGESIDVSGAPVRTQRIGELVDGSTVDQTRVGEAFGTGEVQAASIQGELANLMSQFEGGNTPAWAAGSMRRATQVLAERGLGASSMAGQAIIQAAMEAALPIAQIDTANKQQVAMLKAEQRAKFLGIEFDQAFQAKVQNAATISEIANLDFNASQQIALENSRAANTMELQNLNNEQAVIMSEAAALSQIDISNLNNRQQAQVQNAQNFLQIDMADLSNDQQVALFKNQSLINAIMSDQAAENAAEQFNATSENQTNQFFANLAASVNQFNAAQLNAMQQFNADETNALLEFNSSLQNQREIFNAQNYLAVAQANAAWRQNLATINTSAANEANMDYAQTVNALTLKSLDEIWQRERDIMDYSFTQSENAADRALSILLGDKQLEAIREQIDAEEQAAVGSLLTKIFFSSPTTSLFN